MIFIPEILIESHAVYSGNVSFRTDCISFISSNYTYIPKLCIYI